MPGGGLVAVGVADGVGLCAGVGVPVGIGVVVGVGVAGSGSSARAYGQLTRALKHLSDAGVTGHEMLVRCVASTLYMIELLVLGVAGSCQRRRGCCLRNTEAGDWRRLNGPIRQSAGPSGLRTMRPL